MDDNNCLCELQLIDNPTPTSLDAESTLCAVTGSTGGNSQSASPFSLKLFIARIKRLDFIVVYSSLLILAVLLLVVVFLGERTTWYKSIIQPNINPWITRGLWIIGTILSYVAFFFIWKNVEVHEVPRDLIVSVLFVVTGFLFLAWGVAYYYAEDIVLSLWVAILIFIYNLWLTIYVWYIKPIAALFLIPNLILYIYLLYGTIHTASLNNIPI